MTKYTKGINSAKAQYKQERNIPNRVEEESNQLVILRCNQEILKARKKKEAIP